MSDKMKFLAEAWTPRLLQLESGSDDNNASSDRDKNHNSRRDACKKAIQRTLPLFLEVKGNDTYFDDASAASVPFVCRYRTDIIQPLTTQQVHLLRSMVGQHDALKNLRNKLLPHFPPRGESNQDTIRKRILTSTSKTELEDLYTPFKPPPKGSILERIQSQHPKLVDSIESLWKDKSSNKAKLVTVVKNWTNLGPREAAIQVLGSKIASEPQLMWWVMEELKKHCRVKTTVVKASSAKNNKQKSDKYNETYGDFSARLASLKDYQVLAIRRGVQEKALKMAFDIDSEKMEKHLIWRLRNSNSNASQDGSNTDSQNDSSMVIPVTLLRYRPDFLLKEAVHDAWVRLLRRRGTSRLWKEKCKEAQDRACQVFEDNLHRALLEPPYHIPARPILALDPGFATGIKCALLDSEGGVLRLDTVKFLGSDKTRIEAVAKLEGMLREMQLGMRSTLQSLLENDNDITIALGNGHGSADARALVQEASDNCGIPLDIQLVSEAGASVWSVTKNAQSEFPDHPPAAVAAISIGRRLQNPLFELVKVPPRSLGLGMYQHDLSEKELDEKLHITSVDAVAAVGVDVNSGSLEILQKVPGLSASLSEKIIEARPLKRRSDLLKIGGLGSKSYQNCAGFVRVSDGVEPLDDTLVHPESYELARWLLNEFSWKLFNDNQDVTKQYTTDEWKEQSKDSVTKAAKLYNVSRDRVLAVIENLMDSMSNQDPRLKLLETDASAPSKSTKSNASMSSGLVASCKPLPTELSGIHKLSDAIAKQNEPIRGIVGTVRNVADFGAFIEIGNENNGLLHRSMLGPNLQLSSLLIGQQIGVDVLSVSPKTGRISLGLHGCKLKASIPRSRDSHHTHKRGSSSSFGSSRSSGKKRSISTTTNRNSANISQKRRRMQR